MCLWYRLSRAATKATMRAPASVPCGQKHIMRNKVPSKTPSYRHVCARHHHSYSSGTGKQVSVCKAHRPAGDTARVLNIYVHLINSALCPQAADAAGEVVNEGEFGNVLSKRASRLEGTDSPSSPSLFKFNIEQLLLLLALLHIVCGDLAISWMQVVISIVHHVTLRQLLMLILSAAISWMCQPAEFIVMLDSVGIVYFDWGVLAIVSRELLWLLLHGSVADEALSYAGSLAPAGQDDDAVVKELLVECFGSEGQSEDPSDAFLRDYMQRQAWRGDGDSDGDEAPLSTVLRLPSQTLLHCMLSTSLPGVLSLILPWMSWTCCCFVVCCKRCNRSLSLMCLQFCRRQLPQTIWMQTWSILSMQSDSRRNLTFGLR